MRKIFFLFVACSLLFFGCSEQPSEGGKTILATTTIVKDICQNILPKSFNIKGLMGTGVDPHLYKTKSSDHRELKNADVIIYNGLHLEGKMTEIFENLSKEKTVIALSDGIDKNKLIPLSDAAKSFDPHFWTNPELMQAAIKHLSKQLIQKFPHDKDSINSNTESYLKQLQMVSVETIKSLSSIPEDKRFLITAHDAFSYFGVHYNFKIEAVQGVSTVSEAGLRDITNLIDKIVSLKIPSIFIESSVSEKNITSIQKGCAEKGFEVSIGGTLYSDALGGKNSGAGTYLEFLTYNAATIRKGLVNTNE